MDPGGELEDLISFRPDLRLPVAVMENGLEGFTIDGTLEFPEVWVAVRIAARGGDGEVGE